MKKIFHICSLILTVILMVSVSSCEDITQVIELEFPNNENENPNQEVVGLPATATNLIESLIVEYPDPYIASFDGSGSNKILDCGKNDITIGKPSDGKFNQSYDCSISLDPHELLANAGDIIQLDYNTEGFVADAVFTMPDGTSVTIKGSANHATSITLPEILPDEYIVNGEASYFENNTEYVAKGFVKILSKENMIRKNIKYKDISIYEDCYFEIPFGEGLDWNSSDNIVAKVEGNIVTGLSKGTATISSNDHTFNVTVVAGASSALKNIFIEPCIEWGCNGETVKSYMSSNDYKSPFEVDLDGSLVIRYSENPNSVYMYTFDENGLNISYLEFKWDNYDEMQAFLGEKYLFLTGDDNDMKVYFTRDFKTIVGVNLEGDTYKIVYTSATANQSKDVKRIKEKVNKILKIKSNLNK